jgi:uncharacterized protein YoxC
MALSLAIIALAVLAVGFAALATFLRMRALLQTIRQFAGPALADVRQLIGAIRVEVEQVTATSRDLRTRVLKAADAAEARLSELNTLVKLVQGEVETGTLALTGAFRALKRSGLLVDWGRRLLRRGRKKR